MWRNMCGTNGDPAQEALTSVWGKNSRSLQRKSGSARGNVLEHRSDSLRMNDLLHTAWLFVFATVRYFFKRVISYQSNNIRLHNNVIVLKGFHDTLISSLLLLLLQSSVQSIGLTSRARQKQNETFSYLVMITEEDGYASQQLKIHFVKLLPQICARKKT